MGMKSLKPGWGRGSKYPEPGVNCSKNRHSHFLWVCISFPLYPAPLNSFAFYAIHMIPQKKYKLRCQWSLFRCNVYLEPEIKPATRLYLCRTCFFANPDMMVNLYTPKLQMVIKLRRTKKSIYLRLLLDKRISRIRSLFRLLILNW